MVYDSGNYATLIDKAEDLAGYQDMRKEQAAARQDGRLVGVGMSGCIEASAPAHRRWSPPWGPPSGCMKAASCACTPPAT